MPKSNSEKSNPKATPTTAQLRETKVDLIQRSLGIRHKLKVHESMKAPDTHEDLAVMMLAKWELEDELRAIEELLGELRLLNVQVKRDLIAREGVKLKDIFGKSKR